MSIVKAKVVVGG